MELAGPSPHSSWQGFVVLLSCRVTGQGERLSIGNRAPAGNLDFGFPLVEKHSDAFEGQMAGVGELSLVLRIEQLAA